MSQPDLLQKLALVMADATAQVDAMCAADGLVRAHAVMSTVPASDRQALLDLVSGEVEVCRLRREGSIWTNGSRMHVNRSARIYARHGNEPEPTDDLRAATTRGTIDSVRKLVTELGPEPHASPEILAVACVGLTRAERAQILLAARYVLAMLAGPDAPPASTFPHPDGGR
jgi:hypothetical protein